MSMIGKALGNFTLEALLGGMSLSILFNLFRPRSGGSTSRAEVHSSSREENKM